MGPVTSQIAHPSFSKPAIGGFVAAPLIYGATQVTPHFASGMGSAKAATGLRPRLCSSQRVKRSM